MSGNVVKNGMIFTFGHYKIDVDTDETKRFYDQKEILGECPCAGCRNFEKAIDILPADILNFFESLGVDIRKAAEWAASHTNKNGKVFYTGFCHLNGTILNGDSSEHRVHMIQILNDLQISFQNDCYLLEKDFPSPMIQMEFVLFVPWVLPEENPYDVIND